jgi:flagellar M-ring protein FliF
MARVPAPLAKLGDTLRGFTVGQRTVALIGVAVLILGGITLATFVSQPRYSPLFSGLQPADASTIVEQLRADGVPYELAAGGTAVLVPEEHVYDARLKAAAAGLPTAGQSGYSLLDDMGVTSSEFQQTVTYKRALEGELASTISALDGVKTASVKLAIPEETVFVDAVTEPTASIFVETTPGVALGNDQVQAVVHLTSAAVDGMKPENVAVVDASGNLLSAVGIGIAGGADQQSSDYEQRVAASVQGMLDRVVGRGNATVAVAADMSLESAERVEETFENPAGAPALQESTKTEEYQGTGGGSAGVLGPDNIAVPDGGQGEGTFNSETTDRSNAVNKVTENRSIPSGTLNRQSVSVALNQDAAGGFNVEQLTEMIGTAAGVNAERGDSISVAVVPFNAADAAAAQEALAAAAAAEEAARAAELLRTLVIAGVAVLALVIAAVLFLYLRRNRQNREPVDLGELQEFRSALEPAPEAPATAAIASVPVAVPMLGAESDSDRLRADLDAMAASDPAKMAEHLRSVMDDRAPV